MLFLLSIYILHIRAGIDHIIVLSLGEFVSEFVRWRFILLSQLVSDRRLFIILIELLP